MADKTTQNIGSMVGAVLGAFGGGIVGKAFGGRGGAVFGALAGGGIGYAIARPPKEEDAEVFVEEDDWDVQPVAANPAAARDRMT